MQVSVETGEGLERRMTVELPREDLDQQVEERLKKIARTARMDGFRPGKVPLKMLKKRYGGQVWQEVFGDLVQSSFENAVDQESLRPAGMPRIEPRAGEDDATIGYTAVFEVLPEITLADLSGRSLERPTAEVTDADLERMIDKLRRQRVRFEPAERGAEEGDRVRIDFVGKLDGEPFEGGSGEDVRIVIGSSQMIPGFEDGLKGHVAGDKVTLDLQFPDDYRAEHLAGKPAQFEVEIKEVAAGILPEVDEAFATEFGVKQGGVEQLHAEVRQNMERELRQRIRARVKQQAMDLLLEANPIDVPKVLVDQEIESLRRQTRERVGGQGGNVELPNSLFEEEARRRVALGLLIAEVVKGNQISVDRDRVRAMVEEFATGYENPQEVVDYYYQNPRELSVIENVVLEDQVVDWVVGQARVEQRPLSFEELTGERQG